MVSLNAKAYLAFIILIISLVFDLNAQTTLSDFLENGVKNYPGIKARAAENEIAVRERSTAQTEYLPKITAQHQYTYGTNNSLAGSFFPNPSVISPSGGIRAGNNNEAVWGSYTSAVLEWNIVNFGKVSTNVRAYKKAEEAANANYDNEILEHQVKISEVYLLTLMYAKLSSIQQVNLKRAQAFLEAVSAGVASGMRAGVDSSLASAEQIKAKLLLLQAELENKRHILRLQELTGYDNSNITTIDSMSFFTKFPSSTDLGDINLEHNPLLKYYQLRGETSKLRSISVKRSFLPSITLVGAVWARGSGVSPADDSYHGSFSNGTNYQVYNYLAGAYARWTISDFFSIHQRYKAEYFKSVRDTELYNAQSIRTKRQLSEAEIQYKVSTEQANSAPAQLKAAQGAYQQALARYKSGLADLPTLMQSILTLNRAEADMAISYISAWRSLLAIAAAKGDFSIFIIKAGN